jgi:putative hydrolase of the HAD superfamily
VLWHPKETPLSNNWAARCGLSPEAFDQIVYNSEWGSQSLVGKISANEMWKNIGKQLGLSLAETDECQKEYWAGVWDIDLLNYCRKLKSRYKLGIVSDAESNARKMVKTWVNEELFDVIVFSSEVGVCKPNSYIFQHALEQLEIEATEAVFLDDREKNIIGAKALGIHAIHYENRNQALASLNRYVLDE